MKARLISLILPGLLLGYSTVGLADEHSHSQEPSMLEQMGEDISAGLSDTGTVATIMAKFAVDPLLGPFQMQVFADGDTVTLKGDVETDVQYERAVILALNTDGVKTVDASGIVINASNTPVEDLYLNSLIKFELLNMGLFETVDSQSWSVQLETKEGIVYVTGSADSQATKDKILTTIQKVKGVEEVKDDINVL